MKLTVPSTYLVTGVSGQDGFFTARHFLKKGAQVVGLSRTEPSAQSPHLRMLTRYPDFRHIQVAQYTPAFVDSVFREVRPERIVHCAGFRDIPKNEAQARECFFTNCDLFQMVLASMVQFTPTARIVFLSSAEIFGPNIGGAPLNEQSKLNPVNEYALSKVQGMQILEGFRSKHGLFGSSAICFNHDSFLSPPDHLVRLVPRKLLAGKKTPDKKVTFFNTGIRRDWSHAKDFVTAFDCMLEQKAPRDLIVASGHAMTLQSYIELCCDFLGMDPAATVQNIEVSGQDSYDRVADPSILKAELNWSPHHDIRRICQEMIGWET